MQKTLKIALICGGPSLERGISLNSARSVLDHLDGDGIEIVPVYFDHKRQAYSISRSQLYSNTPSDFDFKLAETAKKLSETGLKKLLKSCDLAFPAMHGTFGEDGGIQRILEKYGLPYLGSPPDACSLCSDKYDANEFIREKGFFTLPSAVLKIYHDDHKKIIDAFFKEHKVKRAIVKPASGGSSFGVFSVSTEKEALEKVELLFSKRMDTRVVIEPFCEGIEFTVIVLQNKFDMPVAVLPTEMEMDYSEHQVFDFRRKYLPSNYVRYHCPPRFDNETIERIQVKAEQLFTALGMRDFARFDGWLMPDGNVWFSDFNPISGMEQNSFLFQQGSRIGMSHRDLLRYIVKNSCIRNGIEMPELALDEIEGKKAVKVLFGGKTSERQVSLMSGTNVWLKLKRSEKYEPKPYLLDLDDNVWELPYALTLNHTVEEILENCESAEEDEARLQFLEEKVRLRLMLDEGEASEPFFLPKKMTLDKFISESEFVFIGLHGGIGENGTLQKMLTDEGVKFNGSGEEASRICMDKYETGEVIASLEDRGVRSAPKVAWSLTALTSLNLDDLWAEMTEELGSKSLIVKPRDEGCSSGIVRLYTAGDLKKYVRFALDVVPFIPSGTFTNQKAIVDMPIEPISEMIFETFIETDKVRVTGNNLKWKDVSGWIEVTVGILEKDGVLHAMNPSLTVAEGEVLTVEEKFQGGTGVNLTPPPAQHVKPAIVAKIREGIRLTAEKLGIEGYARIDAFANLASGEIIVIEANSTPGLTPSTVIYHQALAEDVPMAPTEFLEKLIENKGY